MNDLQQLIEIAQQKEIDPATRQEAVDIYERIINEHDYSYYSVIASESLDRMEHGLFHSAKDWETVGKAKRELSKLEHALLRIAVILYIASLVFPIDGQPLAGGAMLVGSFIFSFFFIPASLSKIPSDPTAVFALLMFLLPYCNVLFWAAMTRFWQTGRSRFSIFRALLYISTTVALVSTLGALRADSEIFYPFVLWTLSFLFLSLTVAVCTEKNRAAAGD
ncbi:MAG: hypothetical protein VX939_09770 [Pseudomonadota bacterium]|nr:hypothetical protein [Pseudomonadota bacterium]